ncbi:MAG: hypothetical protein KF819_28050 [Labilithrix sp.]|nr:hypothetical protein [Labilithrix sp.]
MRISRTAWGAIALAFVVSTASAQESPPPATEPPKADANVPGVGISEEAKRHFAAGVALLQDPEGEKVEEAYREFRTAYDLSGSPKILGNMGFCAMRLERDGEAIEAYTRYLRDVPDIEPDERAQIVRDVQTLSVGVARLTLEVNKPGARVLDVRIPVRGERVTNTYGPVDGKLDIGVRPGHHVITVKLADHEDAVWEVDAFAASRDKHTFVLKERVTASPIMAAPEARATHAGPWIVVGIGGAMMVASAVTGIVALGKTSDIADRCPGDVCPRSFDLESERSSAKTFVRATDVLLIGGALVTLGGLGWLLLSNGSEKEPPRAARALLGGKVEF